MDCSHVRGSASALLAAFTGLCCTIGACSSAQPPPGTTPARGPTGSATAVPVAAAVAPSAASTTQAPPADDAELWATWQRGDLAAAKRLAERLQSVAAAAPAARHVLAMHAFASGDYAGALSHAAAVAASYPHRSEVDRLVVEAHLHRGDYAAAVAAVNDTDAPAWERRRVAARQEFPLRVTARRGTEVPFTQHKLAAFMPGVAAELNGKPVTALFDTGAPFLAIARPVAEKLGIALDCGGEGVVGFNERTDLCFGHALLRLGTVELANLPVVTVKLPLAGDLAIFGTNVLEQLFATIDYPKQRFVFAPRADEAAKKAQLAKLPGTPTRVPFYLWSDHYLLARGSLGPRADLTWFIDSGLVYVYADATGVRQAALELTTADLPRFGLDPAAGGNEPMQKLRLFEIPFAIGLGPLSQTGHLGVHNAQRSVETLGRMRVDGLLSHAFLRHYAWTIDFDAREFLFHSAAESPGSTPSAR